MKSKKIVLTGGPGGGKTTALDIFKREFRDGLVIVPEAATMLFENGLKRGDSMADTERVQLGIYHLQKSLETIFEKSNPESSFLCDRGTLDSLAYWPSKRSEFFDLVDSSFEDEMKRYDIVIFFQTAAASGDSISSNNPHRVETFSQAIELDRKLQDIWSQHPHYHFIPSDNSFVDKVREGLKKIEQAIRTLD